MKNYNFLCVHQSAELYGSDRSFLSTIEAIRSNYHDSTITIVLPFHGPLVDLLAPLVNEILFIEHGTIRNIDLRKSKIRFIFNFLHGLFIAHKTIRSGNFDLIYMNTAVVTHFIIASRFTKTNSIIHIREFIQSKSGKLLSKIVAFSKATIIFNSYATRKYYFDVANEKSLVIHNGVKQVKNHTIDLEQGYLKILHIGRIGGWKGQELLLEALSLIETQHLEYIKIRIVGSSFENQDYNIHSLYELIDKLKLKDIVSIVGFANDPAPHYRWADCVVVSSTKPEPFGRVAIEGMSAGCAILAANHGGITEIVEHEKTGYLFQPNNPIELAKYISAYIKNPKLAKTHGEHGLIRYQLFFTEEIYQENFLSLFRKILNNA